MFIAAPLLSVELLEVDLAQELGFEFDEVRELVNEPGVEARAGCDLIDRCTPAQHLMQREETLGRRHDAAFPQLLLRHFLELTVLPQGEADAALLERAHRLL